MLIKTTFKGPTDYKGSRILARPTDGSARSRVRPYDHALNSLPNHEAAAALFGSEPRVVGSHARGYYFEVTES